MKLFHGTYEKVAPIIKIVYNVLQGIEGAKENTWAKPLNIILAIPIKVLARALSFSETLHVAFRFSF